MDNIKNIKITYIYIVKSTYKIEMGAENPGPIYLKAAQNEAQDCS